MSLHEQALVFVRGLFRERPGETQASSLNQELEHLSGLLVERERRQSIEQGFYRIAALLSEPLSAEETLHALAHAASAALGGDFSAVFIPSGGRLQLAGSHRLPEKLAAALADGLPPAAGVLASCAAQGQVLAARGASSDDRFGRAWRKLARGSFVSLLAIPIDTEDENGLALVFFAEPRLFTDDDLELARNLAHAAKGALERSSMFERERSSRALSQQLAHIGSLLTTELDPERIVSEVVRQVPTLLGADACTIHVLEGDELIARAAEGERTDDALGTRWPSTAGLAGEVLQSRAPLAVEAVAESDPRRGSDPVLAAGYEAYLGVPLTAAKSGAAGVLSAYSREPRQWREEEVEALSALASNASVALSNAELYQQVAVEKELSETILASVADGIVAVDRDDHVVLWNAAAETITGVPRGEAVGRRSADVLRRTLASGEDRPAGNRIVPIPRGGEDLWLSVTEAVLRDPTGEVTGRIFTFRDVSSERLVEQVKSDFVSTVSHQLRAPLTSIYGFAETLLRNDVLFGEEERRTFLRYVVAESERLAAQGKFGPAASALAAENAQRAAPLPTARAAAATAPAADGAVSLAATASPGVPSAVATGATTGTAPSVGEPDRRTYGPPSTVFLALALLCSIAAFAAHRGLRRT